MNKNEALKLNEQMLEAWNKHDVEKFIGLCNENAIWKINNGEEIFRGKKEIREYFNHWKMAFPDLRLKADHTMYEDEQLCVEYQLTGTQNGKLELRKGMIEIDPTHKKISVCGNYRATIKNGKFAETYLFTDRLSLFEQLGVESELMHHA
ncbi:MAG: ester cyclase [Bacteroidota bacterium]|nr:ester cyclase [Bacteroidota bacterium]